MNFKDNEANHSQQLRETVRMLERKLGTLEDFQMSCCGITMAQCHALVEIGRAENISLNELAELLNLESSSMSRTVNNLVNNDLVKRDIDPQDRRYVTITLTESGCTLFKDIEERMNLYFTKVYERLPVNKRDQVLDSLQILLSAIGNMECCK
jgi:DNA-binding MarR family transcriptional regulator